MRSSALVLLFLATMISRAESPAVYKASAPAGFDAVYDSVYRSLEEHRLYVVFEPDIGKNLAGFAERWGEDYNRSQLERIKSMVFCNAWYANQVSNADPDLVALCPLHLTLTHKAGVTSVLFVRPDFVARGSAAEAVAKELTAEVITAIEDGIQRMQAPRETDSAPSK